ncbi:MAG: hypothetical protein ACKOZT_13400 [Cyanobium sp.]
MSQLTIQLSDRADALVAQLQKEIFNRRRKKVSPVAVIETLVESGARCQSDKRFATSWANLVADIEKAAKVADAHGAKPANLSDEEWVMVLSYRTRQATAATPRPAARKAASAESGPVKAVARKARNVSGSGVAKTAAPSTRKSARNASSAAAAAASSSGKAAVKASRAGVAKARPSTAGGSAPGTTAARGAATKPKTATRGASASAAATTAPRRRSKVDATASANRRQAPSTSVARRMAKAVSRLAGQAVAAPVAAAAAAPVEAPSGNGVLPSA